MHSFIEENHATKLSSREQQNQQPMHPGAPSQDLMSYWGEIFLLQARQSFVDLVRLQIRDIISYSRAMEPNNSGLH
jgi:hypothetical protein